MTRAKVTPGSRTKTGIAADSRAKTSITAGGQQGGPSPDAPVGGTAVVGEVFHPVEVSEDGTQVRVTTRLSTTSHTVPAPD